MCVRLSLWILLCVSAQEVVLQEYSYDYEVYEDSPPLNCSTAEAVKGGHVTYSQGGLEGSVLSYHCSPGQYPYPVSYRLCGADGDWTPMRSTSGRRVTQATCRDILCPAQLQLDHGEIWPRNQWFKVGGTQSFSCQEGFTLYGSVQRNCTITGEWTGSPPVCDNHDTAEDCSDPGIPPGAQRSAGRFHVGQKLTYLCQSGLDLLGSAERVCLENREWSGSMPRCLGRNIYDSPSNVAAAMTGSLAGLMDVISPEEKKTVAESSFGRTFNVATGSRMNVYILLDTSGSIKKEDFEVSRNATISLIKKLDSYEVKLKFHVLSFASEAKDIVDITNSEISGSTDDVIWNVMNFDYHSHGSKTGTNLYAALQRVNEVMSIFKQKSDKYHFHETQNIIVIATDGFSNTGTSPQVALARIRNLLGYHNKTQDHTEETLLEVYAFGIGEQVKKDQLNALASKKRGETHVFILKDFGTLGEVFNSIISDKTVTMCGVAQEDDVGAYTKPWHVTVSAGTSLSCFGSIVSQNWVLTAAHCLARASTDKFSERVEIKHGADIALSKVVIMHPKYNTRALKHRNLSEFYDYDVALIQVHESIPLSWKARPICLPCTVPASRAMKRVNATCQQHREGLLPHQETEAYFIHSHRNPTRRVTHIQTQGQRQRCVEKAREVMKGPTDVSLDEYVTDRFLCSGGSSGYKDAISCKGDSGGSLFLQQRKRYFQVGVLSWGITDVCDSSNPSLERGRYNHGNPPPNARDFHIDVFKIMPWLKQHLGGEIQFLPDVN